MKLTCQTTIWRAAFMLLLAQTAVRVAPISFSVGSAQFAPKRGDPGDERGARFRSATLRSSGTSYGNNGVGDTAGICIGHHVTSVLNEVQEGAAQRLM
jgi:hypothetical protein